MTADRTNGNLKMVTVSTATLKERLNRLYDSMRARHVVSPSSGLFDYLWDLKEVALLEGRNEVEVPTTWLEELESTVEHEPRVGGH